MADELVELAISRAKEHPESWWITQWGTILVHAPDVAMYIGGGFARFRFGAAMPPVFGRDQIAPIKISISDRFRLWETYLWVKEEQQKQRRAKAIESARKSVEPV